MSYKGCSTFQPIVLFLFSACRLLACNREKTNQGQKAKKKERKKKKRKIFCEKITTKSQSLDVIKLDTVRFQFNETRARSFVCPTRYVVKP